MTQRRPDHVTTTDFQSDSEDHHRPALRADPYFHGVKEFCQRVLDGRMPYIATVRDDMKLLFDHPGMTLREWATFHKAELIGAAVGKAAVR